LIIWITGLSGVGKTTVAKNVVEKMRSRNQPTIFLDGDELRSILKTEAFEEDFTPEARLSNSLVYAKLCEFLSNQGLHVVISTISMFKEVYQWNRENFSDKYLLVYLKAPLQQLIERDPKGLYQKYDTGLIKEVAGLDIPVCEPENPDLVIENFGENTASKNAEIIVKRVLDA